MATDRQAVYFIGWDYATPGSVPLKALLRHECCPWQAKAIVHDQVWVDAVDDIALMTTADFVALARRAPGLRVVLQVRDPLQRQMWLRRVRDLRLQVMDEGEVLLSGAQALRERNVTLDADLLCLPGGFDAQVADLLQAWQGRLPDASSNAVLRAYVQFLQTGLLVPLQAVTVRRSSHPVLRRDDGVLLEDVQALRGGLAWEIAPQRSNFLEQVLLLGGRSHWRYCFSGPDPASAAWHAGLLKAILAPLGVQLRASVMAGTDHGEPVALAGYPTPDLADGPCLARIDVPAPVPIVQRLRRARAGARVQVRVGDTPGQLLELLQNFPEAVRQLYCDRPGPRGLCARLVF